MKRRRERARRGKYLAILACAGLASACLFLALDSREQILSLSRERKVEFCLEREDGTGEKNGQREEREKREQTGGGKRRSRKKEEPERASALSSGWRMENLSSTAKGRRQSENADSGLPLSERSAVINYFNKTSG